MIAEIDELLETIWDAEWGESKTEELQVELITKIAELKDEEARTAELEAELKAKTAELKATIAELESNR